MVDESAAGGDAAGEDSRHRTLAENAPAILFTLDDEGRFLYADGSGVPPLDAADLVGESAVERFDDHPTIPAHVREALGGEPVTATVELDDRTLDLSLRPVPGDGEVERVFGVVLDVAGRRDREETFADLHGTARSLIEATTKAEACEIAVGAAHRVLGHPLSHAYLVEDDRLSPVAMTEAVEDAFDTLPEFDRGEGLLWDALEAGEPTYFADAQAAPMGSDLPIRAAMVLPLGEHGVLGIASTEVAEFDPTDRRFAELLATTAETALDRIEREQALRERETELERQNERLEEFASVVSHDLRNPLNVAVGHLELAREGDPEPHLDAIEEAVDRMNRLIEDLLALARKGQVVGETEAIDLPPVIEEAWATVETSDAGLEVGEVPGRIVADPDRLRDLLANLFRNAIEHCGDGVTVRIGATDDGFYVADDGPGIPAEEREQVFEPGYSTAQSGTGFGLSIVKEIAEAHGWTVRIAEAESGGARFEVGGVESA